MLSQPFPQFTICKCARRALILKTESVPSFRMVNLNPQHIGTWNVIPHFPASPLKEALPRSEKQRGVMNAFSRIHAEHKDEPSLRLWTWASRISSPQPTATAAPRSYVKYRPCDLPFPSPPMDGPE